MAKCTTPSHTPVFLTHELRKIEAFAATQPLMERAGLAAAELARKLVDDRKQRVLVVAGPGNNGGDAFVVARHLKSWWYPVTVVFSGDPANLSSEANNAYRAWRDCGGETVDSFPSIGNWGLIVDGLFGIGLERNLSGQYLEWVTAVNKAGAPVLALDIPSGLNADNGRIMGAVVKAAHTITFIALKPGLLTLSGPDCCGEIHIADLDLDAVAILEPQGTLIKPRIVLESFMPRPLQSHKGDFGSVGILGGAPGTIGAALLAGRSALKLGAGRVYVATLAGNPVDMSQLELMVRTPEELLNLCRLECLIVGPGLGVSPDAYLWLRSTLESSLPLVLDADALNLIGADQSLQNLLMRREAVSVITPHPAEAARLLACTTAEIQHDRITAAVKLASRYQCYAILKGTGTICANPDGPWAINITGNPGMSSAGTGDVLSGIIAALIAQGLSAEKAMRCGVYLHGAAADELVSWGVGPVGLTASELIDSARDLLNRKIKFRLRRQIQLEI